MKAAAFGDRLIHLREMVDASAREIDRLAGISESHTSQLECAERIYVSAYTVHQIAKVFGVTMDWLYAGDGAAPFPSPVRQSVARAREEYMRREGRDSRV